MIRIKLPWPPRALSPNARPHWAEKHRATKRCKGHAIGAMWEAGLRKLDPDIPSRLKVTAVFCPPNKRDRDDDNMLASCKAYFDGIAYAIGVDDSKWELHMRREDPCKGGAVFIEIERTTA